MIACSVRLWCTRSLAACHFALALPISAARLGVWCRCASGAWILLVARAGKVRVRTAPNRENGHGNWQLCLTGKSQAVTWGFTGIPHARSITYLRIGPHGCISERRFSLKGNPLCSCAPEKSRVGCRCSLVPAVCASRPRLRALIVSCMCSFFGHRSGCAIREGRKHGA
jgi:hypothetical protein